MRMSARITGSCAVIGLLAGCTSTADKKPPAELGLIKPPVLGWRLPKTVLDVTVNWVPTDCQTVDVTDLATGAVQKRTLVDVKVTAEAVARAIPDPDLGKDYPQGLVQIDTSELKSFWTDAAVNYTVFPDSGGLLKTIGSHPVNQTGTIVGNFLTGAVKISAMVAGAGNPVVQKCGTVRTTLDEIKKIRARMPGEAKAKAEDDAQRLVSLKDSITISVTKTIDTAQDKPDLVGKVATFEPKSEDIEKKGWKLVGEAEPRHLVYLFLDFDNGNLLYPCPQGAAKCVRTPASMQKSALFRQAAYVPVLFKTAVAKTDGTVEKNSDGSIKFNKPLSPAKVVAFGQYGVPQTLPLKVGAFRDTNWQLEFSQAGEITSATYANKASGVGLSSAFSGAAGAASDLNGLEAKAAAALDTETLRLQTENAKLKAQTDNYDLKAKLELQTAATKSDE